MFSNGIQTFQEDEISWQLQNKIHYTLNKAYEGISKSFIAKTYADIQPQQRVLWIQNDEVVAHIGITRDRIRILDQIYDVACLGLWASMVKGGATKVLGESLNFLTTKTNLKLAIGRTNNQKLIDYVLIKFDTAVFDATLLGKTKQSKSNDKIVLFKLNASDDEFIQIRDTSIKTKQLIVECEPF